MPVTVERRTLSRRALEELLDQLGRDEQTVARSDHWTAYLQPDSSLKQRLGSDRAAALPEEVIAAVAGSGTGATIFGSDEGGCLVMPPFPLDVERVVPGWDLQPLRASLAREYLVGVVLLRIEGYSVGILKGDKVVDSRTGSRWIHGRNRKGGQSQRRFERTRENHIRDLFDETCEAAQDKFPLFAAAMDYVVFGGDRHTIEAFRKRCSFLQRFNVRVVERFLTIVEPKRATLERLPHALWQSQALIWTSVP